MAVKEYFALEKSCKWPKQRHFIDADIRPHFIVYFGVQKEINGDRGTIVFTATLRPHIYVVDCTIFSSNQPVC